jgi:hypothetical protein
MQPSGRRERADRRRRALILRATPQCAQAGRCRRLRSAPRERGAERHPTDREDARQAPPATEHLRTGQGQLISGGDCESA